MVPAGPVDRAGQAAPMEATVQVDRAEEVRGPLSSKVAPGVLAAPEVLEVLAAQGALAALEVPQAPGVREALAAPDRAAEARDAVSSVHHAVRVAPVDQVAPVVRAVLFLAMAHRVRAMLSIQRLLLQRWL